LHAIRLLSAALLAVLLPVTATAASLVFEGGPGQAAAWKPVTGATGDGTLGYWDRTSYDSAGTRGPGACSAAALVTGRACDWIPRPVPPLENPLAAAPGTAVEYFGLVAGAVPGADAPLDFYFSGFSEFDWTVLFQLTDWDEPVEFGWYVAGNPDARTPIIGPGGPFVANDSRPGQAGTASPDTDFGLYYRNPRFGDDVMFFTQSRFNRMGGYFAYLSEPQFGGVPPAFEDAEAFERAFDMATFQQFVVFTQGRRYWVGLEDQFGTPTPAFCGDVRWQPCSDYDFNDLLIAFDTPEPASLALVAVGIVGMVAARRRR
jgi:hypothetical protein